MVLKIWELLVGLVPVVGIGGRGVQKKVKYSIDKYRKTYELLEKYDKSSSKNPEILAEPERLRQYVRGFSKDSGVRRADSAV